MENLPINNHFLGIFYPSISLKSYKTLCHVLFCRYVSAICHPGAEIYLNGELTIDFSEDIKISVEPNQRVTAELVGGSLKFNYCELGRAIAMFKEQYVIGTIEVRIVRPRRKYYI